jgi:hypothetical protein
MLNSLMPTPFYNIPACMTPSSVAGFMLYAMILALPEINSPCWVVGGGGGGALFEL